MRRRVRRGVGVTALAIVALVLTASIAGATPPAKFQVEVFDDSPPPNIHFTVVPVLASFAHEALALGRAPEADPRVARFLDALGETIAASGRHIQEWETLFVFDIEKALGTSWANWNTDKMPWPTYTRWKQGRGMQVETPAPP